MEYKNETMGKPGQEPVLVMRTMFNIKLIRHLHKCLELRWAGHVFHSKWGGRVLLKSVEEERVEDGGRSGMDTIASWPPG